MLHLFGWEFDLAVLALLDFSSIELLCVCLSWGVDIVVVGFLTVVSDVSYLKWYVTLGDTKPYYSD